MMAVSPLLESNYTHRLTLLQVLTKVSPQIELFIEEDFANYLCTHFLATNFSDLEKVFNKIVGGLDVNSQKKLIEKFSKESHDLPLESFSYLALFKLLVGDIFLKFISENCTIYNADPTGGLFLVDGLPFRYENVPQKNSVYEKFSITDGKVNSKFKSICDTTQVDAEHIHAEQLMFDELKKDKENEDLFSSKMINRKGLLYSRMSRGKMNFSKINLSKDDESIFRKFLVEILEAKYSDCKKLELGTSKLKKMFQTIQNNFSKCRLDNLLKTHCQLPSANDQRKLDLEQLLGMRTTFKDLFKFIYAVYYSIFPAEIFGSKRNQRIFFENIKVLFTASLAVKFRLFDILNGMDVEKLRPLFEDLPFYTPDGFKVEARFLCWIFERIKDIVKSKFYVTEGDHAQKGSLRFYRYDLWARIRIRGIKQLAHNNEWFTLVKNFSNGKDQCMNMYDYLKYSELRLIPKKSSLRPILSLKFYHDTSKREYKLIQRFVLLLLKRATKSPVFDSQGGSADKIYERIIQLKNGDKSIADGGGFYVIRGDFENCYPSMNLIKLLKLIRQLSPFTISQPHERYLLIELIETITKKGNFYRRRKNFYFKPPLSDSKMSKSQSLHNSNDLTRLKNLISNQLSITSLKNHIFSSIKSKSIDLNLFIEILEAYFSNETEFRIGKKRVYRLTKGIRQGTSLASQLCEIYLSNFLHHIFNDLLHIEPVVGSSHFFLRVADDFIFVTRNLQIAKDFATTIRQNFSAEWGLKINESKFTTNFDNLTGELDLDSKTTFFGRKISTRDLSISLDLDSFQSARIADTYNCNPYAPLLSIMNAHFIFADHCIWPEVVDQRVCSLDQIVVNIFERFLMQAFRFVSFLCVSPTWRKYHDKLGGHICLLIYQMGIRVSQRIITLKNKNPALRCSLSRLHLHYISASAFRMLYEKGPHKVQCRTSERNSITAYCQKLYQQNAHRLGGGKTISLPTEIYFPFNKFIV